MNAIEKEQQGLPSASEMHRVMGCPGYLTAKEKWERRKDTGSAQATTGTNVHEAMEYIVDGVPLKMNQTEREQYLTEQLNEMRNRYTTQLLGPDTRIRKKIIEQRMFVEAENVKVLTAKPDLLQVNDDKDWLVIDYKTGTDAVTDASANWQIATAALCVYSNQQLMHEYDMKRVFGVVLQPLVTTSPTVVQLSVEDVNALWTQTIRELHARKSLKFLHRRAGTHCKWCPVGHLCPEGQAIGAIVAHRFGELDQLTAKQLVELNKIIPRIVAKADEAKEFIKQKLKDDPNSIPGLSIKNVSGGLEIHDTVKLFRELKGHIQISPDEYWRMAKISTGVIRPIFNERYSKAAKVTKKAAHKAFEELFKDCLSPCPPRTLIVEADGKPKIEQKTAQEQ